ncbi:MAG TPA: methyl-accepting chemotaxis protein [Opitutaceae bacterium]|nr:methyl-accepting chemotaxis protein [Opitutaceae bacterium]
MKSFLDLPVRIKLFSIFGVIIVLFVAAIGYAYTRMAELVKVQSELREKQLNVTDLSRVLANHNEGRVSVLMMIAAQTPTERLQWIERVKREHIENAAFLQTIRERNINSPAFLRVFDEHMAVRETYAAVRERVFELAIAGNVAEAGRISMGENNDRYLRMRDLINRLITTANEEASASLARTQNTAAEARMWFLIFGAGVLICSFGGVVLLGRAIANPLQDLLVVARAASAGDLRKELRVVNRQDEVGVLSQAFAHMIENIRTVQRDIQEGVNVLATSASEIFTATAQIAASATETATAVSQTTTTAEEVKQTAQVSAQKAGNVADIAQRAAQSAHLGRKAIDESISGMKNVREQMELIAETIVRLSEQSQSIGEIVSSVNDLAEQSNLLAVNAAIEAAKAGEHGRGFAVVAQEIRNLATQSKESTAQIRNILSDIQRATTATVMAAEQGSKAVDAGVKQVNQSGDAIRTLTESIVSAAQAATQITASAQEQLIGIDQVTIAIQNILQASKQNATGTQQAEAGAKNLNQLGQNLKAVAQKFTV